jgi:hypothetical protein
MKRAAIICTVVSGVVLVLGIVEALTNFQWSAGDQNPLFGNPRILLNDGKSALITAGFLVLVSAVMWFLVMRKGHSDQRQL